MKQTLAFLILLFSIAGQAQVIQPALINTGTVTPDVASLGKFGNIPVSYSTGIPGITIPVYEINVGKIKLPVSLDYHAGVYGLTKYRRALVLAGR